MGFNAALASLLVPLGVIAQFLRGIGLAERWVAAIILPLCAMLAWFSRAPEDALFATVSVGIFYIAAAIGVMFGTAALSYKVAAMGKNPDERKAIASHPLVLVTDPNKPITENARKEG